MIVVAGLVMDSPSSFAQSATVGPATTRRTTGRPRRPDVSIEMAVPQLGPIVVVSASKSSS